MIYDIGGSVLSMENSQDWVDVVALLGDHGDVVMAMS